MLDPAVLEELRAFRTRVYGCFGPRRDALFELLDAAITGGLVPSLVHPSPEGPYRRRWGSLYAALVEGEVEAEGVRSLVAQHPLAGGEPIYAVDTSAWPRNDAETSPERGYYHHPSRRSAGKPIVAGWCYCWLAQVGLQRTSRSAPLDVRRVHSPLAQPGIASPSAALPGAGRCSQTVSVRRRCSAGPELREIARLPGRPPQPCPVAHRSMVRRPASTLSVSTPNMTRR